MTENDGSDHDQGGGSKGVPPSAPGFSSVTVVCDEKKSDRDVLTLAADFAAASRGDLTILGYFERNAEWERLARAAAVSPREAEALMQQELLEQLRTRAADALPIFGAVNFDVRIGKPFLEIIRHVLANGTDLLVKTAERRDGRRRHLFSSTDQHLLRKCPCPVFLRVPGASRPAKTILAAVDIDNAAARQPETQRKLNDRVVEIAAKLAAHESASLHLVHAWDAPAEQLLQRWLPSDLEIETYVHGVWQERCDALEELAKRHEAPNAVAHTLGVSMLRRLERGSACTVIPKVAASLKADILVMGTLARTGVPGLIIGNTAEDILNSIDCSVVTVKPPGYVSPDAAT